MTPNERTSYIGRVGGGPRAPRPELETAQVTDSDADTASVEPLAPETITVQAAPGGGGVDPRQPDIGPVAYWRRGLAFALDALVVFWLQFALTVLGVLWYIDSSTEFVNGETVRTVSHRGPEPWGDDFAPLITFIVLAFIYEVVFISVRGQTPAKERLKIRVTRVADGKTPTVTQAMLRSSVVAVFRLVPGALMLVGNLAAFATGASSPFNMRRRALHDYLSGTMVVRYDADLHEGNVSLRRRPGLMQLRLDAVANRRDRMSPQ
jgi:uncharacterized RDD family membrane protein YckC